MRKCCFFIIFIVLSIFVSCHMTNVHTYYCKDRDITFSTIEHDSIDILVFDNSDSIYLPGANGHYLGLQFHIHEDSDIVYFEINNNRPRIYRYIENKYKIKFVYYDYIYGKVDKSYFDKHFWSFYGGCDQGRYTFGINHDSIDMGYLEPLEWK